MGEYEVPQAKTWGAIGVGAASIIAGAVESNQAKKAAEGAANKGQVNIDQLNATTKAIATQNAIDSDNLEKQLDPALNALRSGATQGLGNSLTAADTADKNYRDLLNAHLNQPLPTPLLNAAISKAQSDLAQGGKIDPETQNLITRHALATSGNVAGAGGGLGLGRDITARDLGTSSLALSNQRLQNASQIGGQELQLGNANAANWLNIISQLQGVDNSSFQRYLAATGLAQGIQQPKVGLDPSAIANITVGNGNSAAQAAAQAANISGAQGQGFTQFGGQLVGAGLAAYGKSQTPTYTPYSPAATNPGGTGYSTPPVYNYQTPIG